MPQPLDQTAFHSKAFSFLEKLLEKVDQPEQFPGFAAGEFQRLSGAQEVAIIACLDPAHGHEHRVLAITPQNSGGVVENQALFRLISCLHHNEEIQILSPKQDTPATAPLQQLGVGLSMAIPLVAAGVRIGGLLLFDLPDRQQAENLSIILKSISQVVSLALRSSLHFEAQENLISKRSAELEKQRQSLQAFFDNELVGMVRRDIQNNYLDVNQRWIEMLGYPRSELLRLKPQDIIHPDDLLERHTREQQLKTGSVRTFRSTRRYIRRDGSLFWGDVSATGLYDPVDNYVGMISLIVDVTEQHEALTRLQESEKKFKALLNNQKDTVILHKILPSGYAKFTEINNAALDRYGYTREELLNMTMADLAIQEIIEEHKTSDTVNKLLKDGHGMFESVHIAKSGERIPVEVSATIVEYQGEKYFLSTARDIRERKAAEQTQRQLEEQLRQKYKMEAVGLLAGGMAHNFNNSLGIVLGNVELATKKLTVPAEAEKFLDHAKTALLHTRSLVRQILTYSRQETHEQVPSQLAMIVEQTIMLMKSTIPSSVNLIYRPPEQPVVIMADSARIQEALVNLCNNAVHAMNEKGDLTISLDCLDMSQQQIPLQAASPPGQYARLSVTDTGCGMSSDILDKIFDPFFTTKSIDQGTGMGLATVQGIFDQHSGFTKVNSNLSTGTTFELYFPLLTDQQDQLATPPEKHMPGGTEHILFVDDDAMLTELSEVMLSDMGYRVSTSTDSRRALQLFCSAPTTFDLLITDQTMPGLTGFELIQEALKIRPNLPTILCTGYSSKISEQDAKLMGVSAYCMKPLEMMDFLKTVRTVLDQTRNNP